MNEPTAAEQAELERERADVEISPAQPLDSTRIDSDTPETNAAPGPAHIKHEHSGRMEH